VGELKSQKFVLY